MKKVATEIPENEFKEFLEQLKEEVLMMKNDGLGYVSITCALAKKLTLSAGFNDELTFTASQIKSILDLAKRDWDSWWFRWSIGYLILKTKKIG